MDYRYSTLITTVLTHIVPLLVIVDESDTPIGSADYDLIHTKGLLHRFASVFVIDKSGRLLLQKRARSKPHGGLFSESISAHVTDSEDYLQAASRRLKEELGLDENGLREICKIHVNTEEAEKNWRNNAFVKIYEYVISKRPTLNPLEVEMIEFLPLNQVIESLNYNPSSFVSGFKATFDAYLKNK